jgi:hypothetical protein
MELKESFDMRIACAWFDGKREQMKMKWARWSTIWRTKNNNKLGFEPNILTKNDTCGKPKNHLQPHTRTTKHKP